MQQITAHGAVKREGRHYTPIHLAKFVARELAANIPRSLTGSTLRILDPALGDGSLLEAIGHQFRESGISDFELHGFDTDPQAVKMATVRLTDSFPDRKLLLSATDFLKKAVAVGEPGSTANLFEQEPMRPYEVVIANPPYVRTQVLGADVAQQLSREFRLNGRVDLYHAFILGISRVLIPGGCAGLIVSNRFLTTRTGAVVRQALMDRFEILQVWDLGDTKLFEAAVLPALLFLRRKAKSAVRAASRFSSIYSACAETTSSTCADVITALSREGLVKLPDGQHFRVQHGALDVGKNPGSVWTLASEASDSWLRTVDSHTVCTFGDIGKVRVGVKTTADRVFIRSDWDQLPPEERPELLRPLLTHLDAQRYRAKEGPTRKKIVYPHELVNGVRVAADLRRYPKTRRYLEKHRAVLEARDYVLKAGRAWYEVWVPQDPHVWAFPKLVFRDIAETPTFWLDLSGAVVNGDCYWLSTEGVDLDILWLALGIANSRFIESYYDRRFHNKLYAGRRRFITQYVQMFPLPLKGCSAAREIIRLCQELYSKYPQACDQLEHNLNENVWRAFGLAVEETPG